MYVYVYIYKYEYTYIYTDIFILVYDICKYKNKKTTPVAEKKTILAKPQPPNAANPMPGATGSG
jgi:hypothetical protein